VFIFVGTLIPGAAGLNIFFAGFSIFTSSLYATTSVESNLVANAL
jgi:hypothetical protein